MGPFLIQNGLLMGKALLPQTPMDTLDTLVMDPLTGIKG